MTPKKDTAPVSRDAERSKRDILEVARGEFADLGFGATRIEVIAEKTRTSKRMIYYYFGDKEGLYRAALEYSYRQAHEAKENLDIDGLDPIAGLRKIVKVTFLHHHRNHDFVRMIAYENLNRGRVANTMETPQDYIEDSITATEKVLRHGQELGIFRSDITAKEIHLFITSFSFFRVSNQYTFSNSVGYDLMDPENSVRQLHLLEEQILRLVMNWRQEVTGTGVSAAPLGQKSTQK